MTRKKNTETEEVKTFKNALRVFLEQNIESLSVHNSRDWTVKGFIDVSKNIYTISDDTKVISKILELQLFPKLLQFASDNDLKVVPCREQNHYPDITFISKDGLKFAVDLKSTYKSGPDEINGMTLGAYTGYFRNRKSTKNITFAYDEYEAHIVLGVLYSRVPNIDENQIYSINQLTDIPSVLKEIEFFVREKYEIASDQPGSGNTKNIGSIKNVTGLLEGNGPFAKLGYKVFEDYWAFYMTKDMAKAVDMKKPPYKNLPEYRVFRGK